MRSLCMQDLEFVTSSEACGTQTAFDYEFTYYTLGNDSLRVILHELIQK